MAFSTKLGTFSQPIATNVSFAVTGIGFQPKVILLYANDKTSSGSIVDKMMYSGMATSTSNRISFSGIQISASSGSGSVDRTADNTKCFIVEKVDETRLVSADLVSFDSDGFTLNFSAVDATARLITYIALGGADLTNAFIKEIQPTTTGNVSYTGVGFKPDSILFNTGGVAQPLPAANDAGQCFHLGFTDGTNQAASFSTPDDQKQVTTKVITKDDTMEASLVSLDTDGFTLNFNIATSNKAVGCLCLKGGQFHVGSFNQATSTGNQSITGTGFTPTGLILASANAVSNTALDTTVARTSFGFTDGTNQAAIFAGGKITATCSSDLSTSNCIKLMTENGATPSTNASATISSLDSNGFTINWGTVDATAREIIYFAFGSTAVTTSTHLLSLMGVGT